MIRRGAIKAGSGTEATINKFLAIPNNKDGDPQASTQYTTASVDDQNKVMTQMKEKNLKNSYAFQIRFADRERTMFFPKDEVDSLATDIGIDIDHDKTSHIWFLQQALISELPFGWQKEQDFSGKIVYHNQFLGKTTSTHPNIYKFRVAFNDLLKNESLKQALVSESLKSMTKNEKVCLQMQVNTLPAEEKEAIKKKMKAIIYKEEDKVSGELTKQLIKWLREKKSKFGIQENLKLLHDGKSMHRFKALVDNIDKRKFDFNSLALAEDSELLNKALSTATFWYESIIPKETLACPKSIEELEGYQYADIEEVLGKARELGIDIEKEPYLLWIPRMAICLQLPPFWRGKQVGDDLYYYNIEDDIVSAVHPGKSFFTEFVLRVRKLAQIHDRSLFNSSYMGFYDSLIREYRKAIGGIGCDETQKKNVSNGFLMAAERYTEPAPLCPETNNITKSEKKIGEITDLEILEVASLCGINMSTESHLLSHIEEILRECKMKSEENWEFRKPARGLPYWVSSLTKACTQKHPFISQIQEELEEIRTEMRKIFTTDQYKLTARTPQKIAENSGEHGVGGTYQVAKEEAKKYISEAIKRKVQIEGKPKEQKEDPKTNYNIATFSNFIGRKLTREETLDMLFACPFALGKEKNQRESPNESDESENSINSVAEPQEADKKTGNNLLIRKRELRTLKRSNTDNLAIRNFSSDLLKRKARMVQKISSTKVAALIPQPQPKAEEGETIAVSVFAVEESGKTIETKYSIQTKNVEDKLKRRKLVEDIRKREMDKIKQKKNPKEVKKIPVGAPSAKPGESTPSASSVSNYIGTPNHGQITPSPQNKIEKSQGNFSTFAGLSKIDQSEMENENIVPTASALPDNSTKTHSKAKSPTNQIDPHVEFSNPSPSKNEQKNVFIEESGSLPGFDIITKTETVSSNNDLQKGEANIPKFLSQDFSHNELQTDPKQTVDIHLPREQPANGSELSGATITPIPEIIMQEIPESDEQSKEELSIIKQEINNDEEKEIKKEFSIEAEIKQDRQEERTDLQLNDLKEIEAEKKEEIRKEEKASEKASLKSTIVLEQKFKEVAKASNKNTTFAHFIKEVEQHTSTDSNTRRSRFVVKENHKEPLQQVSCQRFNFDTQKIEAVANPSPKKPNPGDMTDPYPYVCAMPCRILSRRHMMGKASLMKRKIKKKKQWPLPVRKFEARQQENETPDLEDKNIQTSQVLEEFEGVLRNALTTTNEQEVVPEFVLPIIEKPSPLVLKFFYEVNQKGWNPISPAAPKKIGAQNTNPSGMKSTSGLLVEGKQAKHHNRERARKHNKRSLSLFLDHETPDKRSGKSLSPKTLRRLMHDLSVSISCIEENDREAKCQINDKKQYDKNKSVAHSQVLTMAKKEERVVVLQKKANTLANPSKKQRKLTNLKEDFTTSPSINQVKQDTPKVLATSKREPLSLPQKPLLAKEAPESPKMSPFRKLITLKNTRTEIQWMRSNISTEPKAQIKIKALLEQSASESRKRQIKLGNIIEKNKMCRDSEVTKSTTLLSKADIVTEQYSLFSYYIKRMGNPKGKIFELSFSCNKPWLTPIHVTSIAKRFNLSPQKDPDMFWIIHQQLSIESPWMKIESTEDIDRLSKYKIGQHPTDLFFLYVLSHARESKQKIIEKFSSIEKYLYENSWLPFQDYRQLYYLNMFTMEKSLTGIKKAIRFDHEKKGPQGEGIEKEDQIYEDYKQACTLMQQYKVNEYVKTKMKKAQGIKTSQQSREYVNDGINGASKGKTKIDFFTPTKKFAATHYEGFSRNKSNEGVTLREYVKYQQTATNFFTNSKELAKLTIAGINKTPLRLPKIADHERSLSSNRKKHKFTGVTSTSKIK